MKWDGTRKVTLINKNNAMDTWLERNGYDKRISDIVQNFM